MFSDNRNSELSCNELVHEAVNSVHETLTWLGNCLKSCEVLLYHGCRRCVADTTVFGHTSTRTLVHQYTKPFKSRSTRFQPCSRLFFSYRSMWSAANPYVRGWRTVCSITYHKRLVCAVKGTMAHETVAIMLTSCTKPLTARRNVSQRVAKK